jgi:hypothetical protein
MFIDLLVKNAISMDDWMPGWFIRDYKMEPRIFDFVF